MCLLWGTDWIVIYYLEEIQSLKGYCVYVKNVGSHVLSYVSLPKLQLISIKFSTAVNGKISSVNFKSTNWSNVLLLFVKFKFSFNWLLKNKSHAIKFRAWQKNIHSITIYTFYLRHFLCSTYLTKYAETDCIVTLQSHQHSSNDPASAINFKANGVPRKKNESVNCMNSRTPFHSY
jgi:hypothetical protein